MNDKDLRPSHYKEGEDTFAWAESVFSLEQLEAIALFNIHKYTNRDKGQNESHARKVSHYTMWIEKIIHER